MDSAVKVWSLDGKRGGEEREGDSWSLDTSTA
jgi:hypothetical protein